ncbi:MAG: thioredoxin [Flavobacteriaceae bacterium]|nr:thioredoxin [Flavobacteriaceae bacterium]
MSNFFEIIKQNKPVLVDFYATWCGPCKMMSPILEDVKKELGDKITIIKVDVDRNQSLAARFQIRGVPTLALFKKNQQVWRQSGVLQKNNLIDIIHNYS